MFVLLFCQFHGLVVVLQVLTNLNCSLNVEKIAFQTAFREEVTQIVNLLLLYVAVEEQSCVLLLGLLLFVNFLKVFDEVVDLRNIQEAPDYIRWLNETESESVLLDRT